MMINSSILKFCCIATLTFSVCVEGHRTEDYSPDRYFRFDHPHEALALALRLLPPNPIIVDAGAGDGGEIPLMSSYWRLGHIHAFEPVKELFLKVAANTSHLSNVSLYNLALSDQCGQSTLYLSVLPQDLEHVSISSSLYPPKDHLLYSEMLFPRTETINVVTLDKWAEENGIDEVDMLWLDMQGHELSAMKASPKILSSVAVILTEVEFVEAYENQPMYWELKAWLEEQGFILIGGNFDFPHTSSFFGDAFFVRPDLLRNKYRNAYKRRRLIFNHPRN